MLKRIPSPEAWLADRESARALALRGRAIQAPSHGLSFFAPDFALSDQEPWLVGEEVQFRAVERVPMPELNAKAEPSSADFQRSIEDILERIERHEFEKVVPMVCEELEYAEPLERDMFPTAPAEGRFSYGFEFGDEGMAGLTPELLFEVENGLLKTMALAGTGRDDGPSLLLDRKETHEHNLVIEHIQQELKPFGRVDIGCSEERVYGSLKHLYTPIAVFLDREPDFMSFVRALHPTAALGGWPRKPAVEWLEKQPFHLSRRRFGAPFGYKDGHDMKCVVAIRGVQWCKNRLLVASGCGVVKESRALNEWRELELKRASIYRWLGVEA
jgi:menaquinone-specific isochorismate synthase